MDIDPNQIGDIVEVAGQGGKALGSTVDALNKMKNLFSSGNKSAAEEELKQLVGQLSEQLTNARIANLEVVNKLQSLQQSAELESKFRETLSLYKGVTLERGGRVFKLRDECGTGEPWPYVCPVCAEKERKIFPLNGNEDAPALVCYNCKTAFANHSQPPAKNNVRGRARGDGWSG